MTIAIRFPRNCWHVAAMSKELNSKQPLGVRLGGLSIVLFRTPDGSPAALHDRCAHRRAPLSLGQIEPGGIRCLYHGMLFGPDGHCLEVPGQDRVPERARVPVIPVIEQHGWIWVWSGDESLADPASVPPAIAGDHPDWITAQSHLDYNAHWDLLADNLLDFSHLAYVHATSFKADPKWALTKPSVRPLERGVRIQRWIVDAPALASARDFAGRQCDTWQSYDFLIPGILIMETRYCVPGTALKFGSEPPDEGVVVRNAASQAVTATTDRTSRYFYAVALPTGDADQAMCDHVLSVSRIAFEEDRTMIEAQQERIDEAPTVPVVPTAADNAITLFHRVVERIGRADCVV